MSRQTLPPAGERPAYAWPGGYPILYLTRDGLTVCPACANKDPEDWDDPAVAGAIYYEGPAVQCDDCNAMIESAYGNPDEQERP